MEDAAAKLVKVTETVRPEPELTCRYEAQYQRFHRIYPTLKELFPKLHYGYYSCSKLQE